MDSVLGRSWRHLWLGPQPPGPAGRGGRGQGEDYGHILTLSYLILSYLQVKIPTQCEALSHLRPVQLVGGEQTLFAVTAEGKMIR